MPEPIKMSQISARQVGPAQLDPRHLRTSSVATPKLDPNTSFSQVLADSIGEVQRLHNEADNTIRQLVSGQIKDVTDAMVAVEKADVAFRTLMGVRNKIVAAYEEIMRTQV